MDLILSHANCQDGWCAAYIAQKKYPEAEIILLHHGIDPEPVIAQAAGKDVIMLDYSLRTRELNDRLNAGAKSFRILDHHRTAQAALEGADYATFDMKRSGAGLAWDYLFGENMYDQKMEDGRIGKILLATDPRPWWVNYTEDQDLWNWALLNSREINAYLNVLLRTIEAWDELTRLHPALAINLAIEGGQGVRKYIEYYTHSVVGEAQAGTLPFGPHEYKTAVLNIPYAGVSEAGNELVKDGKYDIALLWFERGDGITQFSLRSNREGSNVDVSAIAKYFGGGGHANAAGFQVPLAEGRKVVDTILRRRGFYWLPGDAAMIERSPGGCA